MALTYTEEIFHPEQFAQFINIESGKEIAYCIAYTPEAGNAPPTGASSPDTGKKNLNSCCPCTGAALSACRLPILNAIAAVHGLMSPGILK